jgi:SAM-dependent methyltransferase
MTVDCHIDAIHALREHEQALAPLYAELLDALGPREGSRFLEAGCGAGYGCQLAAARGADVSGFDTRVPLLEIALDRVPAGDFRVGTLERAPFAPRQFTQAIALCALHHAADRVAALRVLELLAVRRATLAICTFGGSADGALAPLRQAAGLDPGCSELESLLGDAGLHVLELGHYQLTLSYPDEAAAVDGLDEAGWLAGVDGDGRARTLHALRGVADGRGVVLRQRLSYALARSGL